MERTGMPLQAALTKPQSRGRCALTFGTSDVCPSCTMNEFGWVRSFWSAADATTYGDVVSHNSGDQLCWGGGGKLEPELGIGLIKLLLDGIAFRQEAVPVRDTFDNQLDLGEPELASVQAACGGDLHVTSKVDQELDDGGSFIVADDWDTRYGGDTAAITNGFQPSWSSGLWAKVLRYDRRLEVSDHPLDGGSEGFKCLR